MGSTVSIAKRVIPPAVRHWLRQYAESLQYGRDVFEVQQRFTSRSTLEGARVTLRLLAMPAHRILFVPQAPGPESVEFKLCALLQYRITTDPALPHLAVFKRKDTTVFEPDAETRALLDSLGRVINVRSVDISKQAIQRQFRETFGYALAVDPLIYRGDMVEKSDVNAAHDGRIVQGPLSTAQVQPGRVYEKVLGEIEDGQVIHYRIPIYGSTIPFAFRKRRPLSSRFTNREEKAEVCEVAALFSREEETRLLEMAARVGLDYGEFDAMRDEQGRLYVIDVNNTPSGPPRNMTDAQKREVLERLAGPFEALLAATD